MDVDRSYVNRVAVYVSEQSLTISNLPLWCCIIIVRKKIIQYFTVRKTADSSKNSVDVLFVLFFETFVLLKYIFSRTNSNLWKVNDYLV